MAQIIKLESLIDQDTVDIMFLKDADNEVWCLGRASAALNLRNAQVVTFGKLKEPVMLLSYDEAVAELAADEDKNGVNYGHS